MRKSLSVLVSSDAPEEKAEVDDLATFFFQGKMPRGSHYLFSGLLRTQDHTAKVDDLVAKKFETIP